MSKKGQVIYSSNIFNSTSGEKHISAIVRRIGTMLMCASLIFFLQVAFAASPANGQKPRVIITSDGEIDDECSLVRCLLYANDFDIEGIISSSSQYHWEGHRWAGNDWANPYLDAYEKVYPNLIKHDQTYPTPQYLRQRTVLGNIKAEGEMDEVTAGSQLIVKVLLDRGDKRPVWLQAWGGTNTIARALKTIEENHPDRMEEVAKKLRFFFIWEQDSTYQSYIKPRWGKFNILTIICDQFWALAYQWDKIMPEDKLPYFQSAWMKANILEGHGPLASLYKAYRDSSDKEGFKSSTGKQQGDFRSEGDSPAFMYAIETGLGGLEHPDWGGWGGRYVKVRDNTWLDPVPDSNYVYPKGRWFTETGWGRQYMKNIYPKNPDKMNAYFKPITRWADALQNDFAARADWCVKDFKEANHAPVVRLKTAPFINAKRGSKIALNATGTYDPDGNSLAFKWWQYEEADTYNGQVKIESSDKKLAGLVVPADAKKGDTIHIICEVTDNGSPKLTRYQRVIVTIQ